MKRSVLFALVVVGISVGVFAQGRRGAAPPAPPAPLEPGASQADVDKALIAAPNALKDQATVIKWKADFTYDTLRKGTRAKPEYGSVWYHVAGADKDHVSPHEVTIAVPGATSASIGLPTGRRENGAWLMNAGTSTAHIMVPGR
jgi:hypothetical protein